MNMNDLQKCQLNILKDFIKVCKKNNLRYYLVSGSCLGAVRHKGFIPWDDDIDVGMPREDYNKLVTLQSDFQERYFIQTYKTDKKYLYNFAKIRDCETTYIENNFMTTQINHGVWLDVFPLDGFSYEYEDSEKFEKVVRRTWRRTILGYPWNLRRKFSKRTFFKDLGLNIVALLTFWTNVGQYRNKSVEKMLTKIPYDKAKTVGNHYGIYYKKEAMPIEWFGEGAKATFEGVEVIIPKEYDKYLTKLYKDYMTPPPPEKRIGHHFDKGLTLTQGYKDYIKEHRM